MQTRSLVLGGAIVLTLGACAALGLRGGGVNIDDTYIEIRPGTKIDPDDQTKLLTILRRYEKKLYWVEDINNHAEVGTLSCVYVKETMLDEVLKGSTAGTSYSAIQIGGRPTQSSCDNTHHTPNVQHPPNGPNLHHTFFLHHTPVVNRKLSEADYDESRALVKEVTPILEKYSHK